MKVVLTGIQKVDFTNAENGERIVGNKIHVVNEISENDNLMKGKRVASIFTRLDCTDLKIGGIVDLVYEFQLGSNKSRLVSIKNV